MLVEITHNAIVVNRVWAGVLSLIACDATIIAIYAIYKHHRSK